MLGSAQILQAVSFCWTADGASVSVHEAGCANVALLHRTVLSDMYHGLFLEACLSSAGILWGERILTYSGKVLFEDVQNELT